MKSLISYSLLAAMAAAGVAVADTAVTTPVGYVSLTCLSDSDTFVSLPLRTPAVSGAGLSAVPDTSTTPGSAVLSLSGAALTANAFQNTHYAKFKTGASAGKWFVITSNTTSSVTVDLNGGSVSAASGDSLEVIKLWTLGDLFDPAAATTDPLTTPNAIVASINTSPGGRRTEVVIPDLTSVGSNLAPNKNFYINAGIWKQAGQGATSFNNFQLWPDTHFIIRNPSTVTAATKYVTSGEVDLNKFAVDLATNGVEKQDNYVGLTRPVDITMNQLTLGGTSAFVDSLNSSPGGRRDEVLIYDNTVAGQNKSPSANYYYFNSAWRKVGQAATIDAGGDLIAAGNGIIVRKYQVSGGLTASWVNNPSYTNQ